MQEEEEEEEEEDEEEEEEKRRRTRPCGCSCNLYFLCSGGVVQGIVVSLCASRALEYVWVEYDMSG